MHAVLPHRVVVHVHSVNTIAWAVRDDARAALEVPLAGLDWAWIPYVASGIPLAHAIAARLVSRPHTSVFVLGNHGLVIGAESCRDAEMLLEDVERRLAIHPRGLHQADIGRLVCRNPGWRLPEDGRTHALGTDPLSRRIISGGILYPCQALFLGGAAVPICGADGTGYAVPAPAGRSPVPVFAVIEDYGVVVRSAITHAESEMFRGFVNVVQRIPSYSVIRYLAVSEVRAVEHNLSNYVTNQRGDCIARDVNGALA